MQFSPLTQRCVLFQCFLVLNTACTQSNLRFKTEERFSLQLKCHGFETSYTYFLTLIMLTWRIW